MIVIDLARNIRERHNKPLKTPLKWVIFSVGLYTACKLQFWSVHLCYRNILVLILQYGHRLTEQFIPFIVLSPWSQGDGCGSPWYRLPWRHCWKATRGMIKFKELVGLTGIFFIVVLFLFSSADLMRGAELSKTMLMLYKLLLCNSLAVWHIRTLCHSFVYRLIDVQFFTSIYSYSSMHVYIVALAFVHQEHVNWDLID